MTGALIIKTALWLIGALFVAWLIQGVVESARDWLRQRRLRKFRR